MRRAQYNIHKNRKQSWRKCSKMHSLYQITLFWVISYLAFSKVFNTIIKLIYDEKCIKIWTGIISLFQKLCSDAQVKVFGKCCQLKPGGDSSSSLDSSMTSSSDVKDQCPKYQVRSLMSFIFHSFTNIFEYLQCVVYYLRDWGYNRS